MKPQRVQQSLKTALTRFFEPHRIGKTLEQFLSDGLYDFGPSLGKEDLRYEDLKWCDGWIAPEEVAPAVARPAQERAPDPHNAFSIDVDP